ncbi:Winged helix-turn-helix [uncultured archaeon]|nr:Winged helix-turn-helix [uncultured archaeon]
MTTKKRERLDVIRDIISTIKENRQIKPTRLLYASNLSPQMFKEYINELIEKKFIKLDVDGKDKKSFSLTKKGSDFLQEYKVIESFIENFGL